MSTKFGLTQYTLEQISSVFDSYPEIHEVILYGSRAIGNFRNSSDIDLTMKGKEIELSRQFSIENELDDLLLPYKIDLSIYASIENEDLVDHIDRIGKPFFVRIESGSQTQMVE